MDVPSKISAAEVFAEHITQQDEWKNGKNISKESLRKYYTDIYKPNSKIAKPTKAMPPFGAIFWVSRYCPFPRVRGERHFHWWEYAYGTMDRVCFHNFCARKGRVFKAVCWELRVGINCVPERGWVSWFFVPVSVCISQCHLSRGIPT